MPMLERRQSNTTKGLGEHVCKLKFCCHILKFDLLRLHAISDEMIPELDVLRSVVHHWVLRQGDCGFVVDLESHCLLFLFSELAEQAREPDSLTGCCGSCDVL